MDELLAEFQKTTRDATGREYHARAWGHQCADGHWEGWLEFIPVSGGDILRTSRETTQPNRTDTAYWATGLEPVYLEGALRRAVDVARS